MAMPKNPFKNKKCVQLDHVVREGLDDKMSTAASDDKLILDADLDSVM